MNRKGEKNQQANQQKVTIVLNFHKQQKKLKKIPLSINANWHINLQTMSRKFTIKTSIMVVVPPQRKAKSSTSPLKKRVALEVVIFLGQNCHDSTQSPEKKKFCCK